MHTVMSKTSDVIVIGAGAAGLAAAAELGRAGLSVSILEARDRIGGRMFTQRDPVCQAPIELGAEFIHGLPPEIWELLQKRNAKITEVSGEPWCVREGRLSGCDFFSEVDDILKQMDANSSRRIIPHVFKTLLRCERRCEEARGDRAGVGLRQRVQCRRPGSSRRALAGPGYASRGED